MTRNRYPDYTPPITEIEIKRATGDQLCRYVSKFFKYGIKQFAPLCRTDEIEGAFELVDFLRDKCSFWVSISYKEGCGLWTSDGHFVAGYEVRFRCVLAGTRGYHVAADIDLSIAIMKAALTIVANVPIQYILLQESI